MKGKKIIAVVAAAAIVAGAAFGGVTLLRNRGGEVNVYPAERFIAAGEGMNLSQTDGVVSTDRIQSVYLSSTQVVTEIYVEEGQTVREGDPILAFDTTLSELNLQRQSIKVDQVKLDIANAEKELRAIDTYRIGTGGGGGYTPVDPTPTEAPLDPVPGLPFLRTGSSLGIPSDPLIYLWNDHCVFSADFISQAVSLALANRHAYLYGGEPEGPVVPVDPISPTSTPEPTPTPTPTPTAEPTDTPTPTTAPTATPDVTAEPQETATPTPEPTVTPEPTEEPTPTPEPTPTEEPTPTPEPTATPEPTEPAESPAEDEELEGGTDGAAPVPVAAHTPAEKPRAASLRRSAPEPTEGAVTPEPTVSPEPTLRPDLDPAIVAEIAGQEIYVVFEVREADALEGSVLRVWEMAISVDHATGVWSFRMVEPSYDPGDGNGEYQSDGGSFDDYYFDDTVYYTAGEIAQMKAEVNQRLKDLNLELKQAELEYDRLEYELSNGEVFAKIDGVVKTLRDPDEARQEKRPMVLISGGGGYYVTAVLGEFDLDTMRVGDAVTVMSWESGEQTEGSITEISEYPDEANRYWYYSEGNQNVSKYPFRVFVNEDASLREGEGVTLTYSSAGGAEGSGLFLEIPFVRQENGKSYLFVRGEDGLLEKRFVRTGKNLWGAYIEILDGLTTEDYIAFPYGRQTVDGARTRVAEADELYSSMYYG